MLRIADIEIAPVTLDFSSSGQGSVAATTISARGIRLCNALELVEVGSDATQVEVCGCCGTSHCAPGGWVSLRRCGSEVLWIPAWDVMQRGAWELEEYRPPSFLQTHGVPAFAAGCWERLRQLHSAFPAAADLPSLTAREAVRLCQHSAPLRVLGSFPDAPVLRRDLLLAVMGGDLASEADEVDRCARRWFEAASAVAVLAADAPATPIEFLLDAHATPSWAAFGRCGDRIGLLPDGSRPLVLEES